MRVAILHAQGDQALAEQARHEMGVADVIIAPLSTRVSFGAQLVLLVLWTARTVAQTSDVARVCGANDAVVLWRRDGAPVPASLEAVSTVGSGATWRAIAPALRLVEIARERPQEVSEPRSRRGGITAVAAIAVGATAALGVAGALAFVGDANIDQLVLAARSAVSAP